MPAPNTPVLYSRQASIYFNRGLDQASIQDRPVFKTRPVFKHLPYAIIYDLNIHLGSLSMMTGLDFIKQPSIANVFVLMYCKYNVELS